LDKSDALTPLMESVVEMYSETSSRAGSYTYTIGSPGLEEDLDSPSVYSMCLDDDDDEKLHEEEDPIHQSFLHDWANSIHVRDPKVYEVPEGRLLPSRVATIQLKSLLRRRREEAGLPVGGLDSPDD
jgi:hypothetical protein